MEIRQLKHFIAIVEAGSFTRGAEQVHLSQPSISSSIAKLEDELGGPLFIRNRKQIILTPEGEKLKVSATRILKEYSAVKASFGEADKTIHLKLCVASNYPLPKLSSLLAELSSNIPELSFSITDTAPDKMLAAVGRGEYDLAFGITYDGELLPKGIRTQVIEEEPYGIAVPSEHPFSALKSVALTDIVHEPAIEIRRWEYRNVVIQRLKDDQISLNIKHRVDQYHRALSLVKSGLAITVTASGLIEEGEGITFIPFKDAGMVRRLTVFISESADEAIGPELARYL